MRNELNAPFLYPKINSASVCIFFIKGKRSKLLALFMDVCPCFHENIGNQI